MRDGYYGAGMSKKLQSLNIELDASDTQNARIFGVNGSKAVTGNLNLSDEYLQKLSDNNVEHLSVYYNPKLIALLKKTFPDQYRSEELDSLIDIRHLQQQYDLANEYASDNNCFLHN